MSYWDDLEAQEPKPTAAATPAAAPEPPKEPSYWDKLDTEANPPQAAEPQSLPWGQVAAKAVYNTPHSALEFGKNLVQPFIHPLDTAEAIGNLGLGVMEKLGMYGHAGYEKYADAAGKMLVDRYGSVDNVKKTLAHDPVGVAGDLSVLFTGGGSALAGASRSVGLAGKTGETIGRIGSAVDPLNAVTGPLKLAGKGAAATLGYDTGAGMRNIEEASRAGYEGGEAGKTFRENQLGRVPGEDFVREAYQALQNMKEERGNTYRSGMVDVGQSNTILDWRKVGDAIREAHDIRTYKGQELDPATTAIRSRLDNTIIHWMQLDPHDFHTAEGFDALKKKLSNFKDATEVGTPERVVANKYYNAVRQTIVDQVPQYARVMKGYEEASDLVRQIEKTLSLPADERRLNIDTALRKLQSTLRKNVNTNYGQRERLLDYLEASGAPHLRSAIAGQALSSPEAHGLARLLPAIATMRPHSMLHAIGSLGISSPRVGGSIAYRAGQLARPLKLASPVLNKPAMRAAQQMGRLSNMPEMHEARGGAVDRALRSTKVKHG